MINLEADFVPLQGWERWRQDPQINGTASVLQTEREMKAAKADTSLQQLAKKVSASFSAT